MKHWWVPGLQIGYEHTFIHQIADFLQAIGKQEKYRHLFRWTGDGLCDRGGVKVAKTRQWEKVQAA